MLSAQSMGLGTTAFKYGQNIIKLQDIRSHRREIVDERDLGLGHVTHVCVAYVQRVASPTIYLAGCRRPKHIIKQYIPLRKCQSFWH